MGKFALTLQCLNHILTTNQSSGHDFRLSSLISSAGDRGSIPRRRVIFLQFLCISSQVLRIVAEPFFCG
jgi:hypothetical protein